MNLIEQIKVNDVSIDGYQGTYYSESPEFVQVTTDVEGKLLEGIKSDGNKIICGNLEVKGDIICDNINLTFDTSLDIDALSSIISSDKLEYIQIETDSENKILSGRNLDGTKFENMPFKIQDTTFYSINNPEWIYVITDSNDKVICGIKLDCSIDWFIGVPKVIQKTISEFISATKDPYDIYEDDVPENIGVYNAIKKAKQMQEIEWFPVSNTMPYNDGTFIENKKYIGIPYSSVKEYSQFLFENVSLETFMTAVKNPRSVLYTENVKNGLHSNVTGRDYHGSNCACYYGSVCSGLTTFAYGIPFNIVTEEYRNWEEMEIVEDQSAYGAKLADAVWTTGHITFISNIKRNRRGVISIITITENAGNTTYSTNYTPEAFNKYLVDKNGLLMRYKKLYLNKSYQPLTEFVAVENEKRKEYVYNEDICPNYGDKANYNEGDNVILNILSDYSSKGYTHIEIQKDESEPYLVLITSEDIVLSNLSYGMYKARLTDSNTKYSDYCYWMVVNMEVSVDVANNKVTFESENATPVYYNLCDISGSKKPAGLTGLYTILLTSEEISNGEAVMPYTKSITGFYMKVFFKTLYGVSNKMVLIN